MRYFLIVFLALFLFGCDSNKEELARLRKENTELKQGESEKNKYIQEATLALNDIHDTLMNIQSTIKFYEKGLESKQPDMKQQILLAIDNLKKELQTNKNKLSGLQEKLKQSSVKIAGLEALVEKYKVLVSEKEVEIDRLNQNVLELKEKISEKETQIAQKDITIKQTESEKENKDVELNTLYVLSGKESDLLDANVIIKKGTWPFRTLYFSELPDESKFTKTDLRFKKEILIDGSYDQDFANIKILPDRDKNIYSLEPIDQNSFKLVIKDTKNFVKISKYLTIVIE